jgi:hypothetical protein
VLLRRLSRGYLQGLAHSTGRCLCACKRVWDASLNRCRESGVRILDGLGFDERSHGRVVCKGFWWRGLAELGSVVSGLEAGF